MRFEKYFSKFNNDYTSSFQTMLIEFKNGLEAELFSNMWCKGAVHAGAVQSALCSEPCRALKLKTN